MGNREFEILNKKIRDFEDLKSTMDNISRYTPIPIEIDKVEFALFTLEELKEEFETLPSDVNMIHKIWNDCYE